MRCCQNKTSFSWSYRYSSKRSLENNVKSRRGKRKIHTLEAGGHMQMAKSDPEAQRKSLLLDYNGWKDEFGSFNLEPLTFLMHFREPGSSFYFYIIHTHIFLFSPLFLILIFLFFLYFSHFFLFFFLIKIFYLLSLNSKIALYLPPPPCLDVACPQAKR
jgi:hypothetical protein